MRRNSYSFKQWCLDNNRQDILDRWDYKLNDKNPDEVSFKSNKKYWFKCPENRHESQKQDIQYIASGRCKDLHCTKCDSFIQHISDEFGIEYFNKIWNENNTLDPWKETRRSNKKGIFNCLENEKHIYTKTFDHFSEGVRCPYCSGLLTDKDLSLGMLYPEVFNVWSEKNKDTPYEYLPKSGKQVWWKCENGIHEDFKRVISASTNENFKCGSCLMIEHGKERRTDLTGKKFNSLTCLYIDEEKTQDSEKTYWICLCDCGALTTVSVDRIMSEKVKTCGNKTIHYSGENAPGWKGGITPENIKVRNSPEYIAWRNSVYAKDWYTCQCCGAYGDNVKKHAHHIRNFSNNTELRFDITNGITLCYDCHYSTADGSFHNLYSTSNNTPEQLEEYINNKRKQLGINIPFVLGDYLQGNILKQKITKEAIYGST